MKAILEITQIVEKRVLVALTITFFILIISYTYLVAATVFHVTARKNIQYQAQVRAADVASLESTFLRESSAIVRVAKEGTTLLPVTSKRFVRIAPGRTLTLYDES